MKKSITEGKLTETKHRDESMLLETVFVIRIPEKLHNLEIHRKTILPPFQPPFYIKMPPNI